MIQLHSQWSPQKPPSLTQVLMTLCLGSYKTFAIPSFHMCYEINVCHFVLVIALNLPKPKYQLRQGGVHGSNSNLYGVDAAGSADGGDKLRQRQRQRQECTASFVLVLGRWSDNSKLCWTAQTLSAK